MNRALALIAVSLDCSVCGLNFGTGRRSGFLAISTVTEPQWSKWCTSAASAPLMEVITASTQ